MRSRKTCTSFWSVLMSTLIIFSVKSVADDKKAPLVACEDGSWPPYTFMVEKDGAAHISGVSYDLLEKLTQKMGLVLDFKVMPWKRCLAQVLAFESTKMDMFINGSSNDERMEKYLRTLPVYNTRRGYAYHRDNEKALGNIKQVKDLNAFHVCGVLGYNYDDEIKGGLTKTINTRPKSVQDAMDRVMDKKCDVFLTTYEVMQGGIELNNLKANDDLRYKVTPGLAPAPVYYWITRSSPRSKWLLDEMNNAIVAFQKDGTADKVFQKYLSDGDGIN